MTENLDVHRLAAELGARLSTLGWRVTTAESCTGGAIAAAITSVAGSSEWFDGAIVSYADRIKAQWLGVPVEDLKQFGAVSEEVVRQMASSILHKADANIAVAVSGIAGPDGGSAEKPVGTVWIAWAHSEGQEPLQVDACCMYFRGERADIQSQTVVEALRGILAIAATHG